MINFFKKNSQLFFIAIVLLAFILRFYKLGEIPNGLNRDEASLGYTAYSLLSYGTDEHGAKNLLNIESFGDWKLPIYVYVLIPFIKIFGLSDWTVRLPSTLSGILIVVVTYYLLKEILIKETKILHWLPLISALFLAISPWSVHFSRISYEANLALLFFALGLLLFTKALHGTFRTRNWLLPLSAVFFVATIFTYHAYQILTPLIIIFLAAIFIQKNGIKSIFSKRVIMSIAVFLFGSVLFLSAQSAKSNQVKLNGLTIFSAPAYREELFRRRQLVSVVPFLLSRVYASTPTLIVEKLITNTFDMLDPHFLFLHGGSHGSHNITGIGNLYAVSIIFVILGLTGFVNEKKEWQKIILGWLILAALPALITIEASHSTRFSSAIIPLEIISAYGFLKLLSLVSAIRTQDVIKKVVSLFFCMLIFSSFIYYLILYFVVFPQQNENRWPGYMRKLTSIVANNYSSVDQIFMQGESSSPYIYFLFYHHDLWDHPNGELYYYPVDGEGFHHVARLGNIYFQNIDWNELETRERTSLVVVTPKELPEDKVGKEGYSVIDSIADSKGETLYLIIKIEGKKS